MVLEGFVALRTRGGAIVRHPSGGSVGDHLPAAREAALAPIESGSTRAGRSDVRANTFITSRSTALNFTHKSPGRD
jgi:hypothetical protein